MGAGACSPPPIPRSTPRRWSCWPAPEPLRAFRASVRTLAAIRRQFLPFWPARFARDMSLVTVSKKGQCMRSRPLLRACRLLRRASRPVRRHGRGAGRLAAEGSMSSALSPAASGMRSTRCGPSRGLGGLREDPRTDAGRPGLCRGDGAARPFLACGPRRLDVKRAFGQPVCRGGRALCREHRLGSRSRAGAPFGWAASPGHR
jgi:hypothetical protein